MKTHIVGLYTTIYHVADITRARNWYEKLLGQRPYFDQPFYVGFNVAGHELGLLPQAETKGKTAGCVAYWGVKNITAAAETLKTKGLRLFEPITDVGGGIKVASFLDVDENVVGLIENPNFPNTCSA